MFLFEKEYEFFNRIGVMPFRSHYIPFLKNDTFALKNHIINKNCSSEFISLNGEWEFLNHKSINEIKDINEVLSKSIDVPSCVQCRGYDYFQYTNIVYPIPFNPPFVPIENPAFHYRKSFTIKQIKNLFLIFEGVDSAFYVFINGIKVGYSQISHSKSEFNITKYVKEGINTVDVIVLKWCVSTYLEDQDKFRFTGIFRDVYLLNRPNNYIWDYKIEPIYKQNKWYIRCENLSNSNISILFLKNVFSVDPSSCVEIYVKNPILWDDQNPYLYKLQIFNDVEKIYEKIGLRRINIENGIFLINGKHIKLKGVNRHESNPYNGATVTIKETLKDLLLIKSINANAIRTCHYPDIPEFYELCDYLGIYVIDEGDLECHGATLEPEIFAKWKNFVVSHKVENAILDREISLYQRDKNRTCVIIWSLGNESGWGKHFYLGADYLHANDSRPIHYENIYYEKDGEDYYTNRLDICSKMYASVDAIKSSFLSDPKENRPFMLCEYTHAMGNSCGDVKDYWDLINSTDKFFGAFVWEWCDHVVTVDGKFKYGSDFPERHNDGNFCCDGLVTAKREFKSSTYEIKAVYDEKFKEPKLLFNKFNLKYSKDSQLNVFFNANLAYFESLAINKNILIKPLKINLTKANIDNEMHDTLCIDNVRESKYVVEKIGDNKYKIIYTLKDANIIDIYLSFAIKFDVLELNIKYKKHSDFYLQRVGLTFSINKTNDEFEYVGFGPYESYIDKHYASKIGKYKFLVSKENMIYIKPQDYGNHYYCSYFKCNDLIVTADKPFSFSALPFSEEQLLSKKHNYELKKENATHICVDVESNGVGTHSCGPSLDKKYQTPSSGENTFFIKILRKKDKK